MEALVGRINQNWGWVGLVVAALIAGMLGAGSPILALALAFVGLGGLLALAKPRWLLLAAAFSVSLQFNLELPQLFGASVGPLSLIAFGLILAIIPRYISRWPRKIPGHAYLLLWIAYVLLGTIAIALGPLVRNPIQGVWAIYRIVWTTPLLFIGIWIFVRTSDLVRNLIGFLVTGSSLGAAIAVIQTLTGGRVLSGLLSNGRDLGLLLPLPNDVLGDIEVRAPLLYLSGTNLFRGHGTFLGHNGFGVLLSSTIFLSWGMYQTSAKKYRLIWFSLLCIQVAGLIATFSRSAWAAVTFGFGLIILWNSRDLVRARFKRVSRLLLFLGMLLVATILTVFLISAQDIASHFATIFSPLEAPEFFWRVQVWQFALDQIIAHPLIGTGTSTIENAVANIPGTRYIDSFSTHNLFMDIAYQRGLLALGIYLFLWVLFLYHCWWLLKIQKDAPANRNFLVAILVAGVTFLISGVGNAAMMLENLSALFWILLGVVAAYRAILQNQKTMALT